MGSKMKKILMWIGLYFCAAYIYAADATVKVLLGCPITGTQLKTLGFEDSGGVSAHDKSLIAYYLLDTDSLLTTVSLQADNMGSYIELPKTLIGKKISAYTPGYTFEYCSYSSGQMNSNQLYGEGILWEFTLADTTELHLGLVGLQK